MDANEIVKNEEVMEVTTEELAAIGEFSKGFKHGLGLGVGVICGLVVYEYVAKPVIKKLKEKRTKSKVIDVTDTVVSDDAEAEGNS